MKSEMEHSREYVFPNQTIKEEERRIPPPSGPPGFWLIGEDDRPPIAATLSAADWLDLTPGLKIPVPEESVEWPEPVARGGRTTIEFQSESRPYWFSVAMGTEVNPANGLPTDPSTGKELPMVHDFQYHVGGRVDAPMRYKDGVIRVDCLPGVSFPEEFVVVFAAWSAYPNEYDPEQARGLFVQVYGNWIFHFVNE